MRAVARKTFGLSHVVSIREHRVRVDAARADGGEDSAPSPEELLAASLASCAAMTIEMYARRKGWELANVEVEVEYALAKRGAPTKYIVTLALPTGLSDEEIARVRRVAARCPVHRTLRSPAIFRERLAR